jgi:HEAT repeat-containing protein 5
MSASFHLKKILGVLNSLSSDPHPAVHFWALESISRVADSADLNFGPHVTGALGLAAQLYMADTHNEEASALAASNFEVDLPTPAVVARCIDSIINVLGPDLQDATKARDLVMALIDQFQVEDEELVLIQSLRCQEHLSLYTPGHMDFTAYVKGLQADLDSALPQIRAMATEGLNTLMRRNADEVTRTANPGLEEQLWLVLDKAPDDDVVKNVMRNWLHQTGLSDTAVWVQRCNSILTKIAMKAGVNSKPEAPVKLRGAPDIQDDEVAGFAAAAVGVPEEDATTGSSTQELLKWQTRTFAMDLLSELLTMVARDANANEGSPAEAALQSKVADVVRIAFSASTAGVVSLRLRGLRIIDQVLKV